MKNHIELLLQADFVKKITRFFALKIIQIAQRTDGEDCYYDHDLECSYGERI